MPTSASKPQKEAVPSSTAAKEQYSASVNRLLRGVAKDTESNVNVGP
jgi:hypothetical protein